MEQDKQLKAILLNSAEGASAGFTDAVMKKVAGLSAKPAYYQPLVSPKTDSVQSCGFATSMKTRLPPGFSNS